MNFDTKFLDNLIDAEKKIWSFFVQGTVNKKSYFNSPSLGSFNKNIFSIRTLILRKAIHAERLLTFYSDIRSRKISDILVNDKVVIHVYDKKKNMQVQCYGKAKIISNCKESKMIWNKLSNNSKKNYASKKKPGSKTDTTSLGQLVEKENAFKNFCIINLYVKNIICLHLLKGNNKKAQFNYNKNDFSSSWLVP